MRNWEICKECKYFYYQFDITKERKSMYECGVATDEEELSSYNSKEEWINELPIPKDCPFKLEQIVIN